MNSRTTEYSNSRAISTPIIVDKNKKIDLFFLKCGENNLITIIQVIKKLNRQKDKNRTNTYFVFKAI